MFSRTTASPSESGVVAFMTSTLSCDDWNSDSNWPASLVASFLCGPPDQPPAPPTYLIEMCACTARSRAEPLRESSARRSAGAAPRCPKAESIAKLMVTIEKRFSSSVRMDIEAQWNAISNLFDDFTCAPVGVLSGQERPPSPLGTSPPSTFGADAPAGEEAKKSRVLIGVLLYSWRRRRGSS